MSQKKIKDPTKLSVGAKEKAKRRAKANELLAKAKQYARDGARKISPTNADSKAIWNEESARDTADEQTNEPYELSKPRHIMRVLKRFLMREKFLAKNI